MPYTLQYFILGCCYACYVLGLFHGAKKNNWQYFAVAVAAGVAWPAMIVFGMLITHWGPKDGR